MIVPARSLSPNELEILADLQSTPRQIRPKFLYDTKGSELFDEICRQPEYYVTRTETEILTRHRDAIATAIGSDCVIVEPGAGACQKIRVLLGALDNIAYMPVDIAGEFLRAAAAEVQNEYPSVEVTPFASDFTDIAQIPRLSQFERRVWFYPGSTIGNFTPMQAKSFLSELRALAEPDGGLLIGVDRHKSTQVLNAAYNDAAGITARFILNSLRHIGQLLDTEIDVDAFELDAFYNESERRIEIYLRCIRATAIEVGGTRIEFNYDERILSEYSYKYEPDDFAQLLRECGFEHKHHWTDPNDYFSVFYCTC